jgi:hypothetical protein
MNKESSTASDFEFPYKPLLGPSTKLMQPQPSFRVVQGSTVCRQHVRGVCWRWIWCWGDEAFLRPFLHWQCQLDTVLYTVPYYTVQTVQYGRQTSEIGRLLPKNGPYRTHGTVLSDRLCTSLIFVCMCMYVSKIMKEGNTFHVHQTSGLPDSGVQCALVHAPPLLHAPLLLYAPLSATYVCTTLC